MMVWFSEYKHVTLLGFCVELKDVAGPTEERAGTWARTSPMATRHPSETCPTPLVFYCNATISAVAVSVPHVICGLWFKLLAAVFLFLPLQLFE